MNPFRQFLQSIQTFFMKSAPTPDLSDEQILRGDGTWPWNAYVSGDDIIVLGARATCFGGANDPQDSGETASGISTKLSPCIRACALPMIYTGNNKALRRALGGSPIPKLPWMTKVEVTANGKTITVPVIDLGPAKRTGNAIDLTIAAAREFERHASATSFALACSYRILGAAKYARGTHA